MGFPGMARSLLGWAPALAGEDWGDEFPAATLLPMKMDRWLTALSVPLWFLAACGGGGGGPSGSADFLVTDAPSDELLSFSARVTELRLLTPAGAETGNYLKAPVTLEILGLQGVNLWLASAPIPAGTYSAVVLRFDGSSLSAKDLSGDDVAITSGSNTLVADLTAPVEVLEGGYVRFATDINIDDSLSGLVSSGSLVFNPSGACFDDDSPESPIDEFKGVVQSFDAAAQTLVVAAYVDDDLIVPLGNVDVAVSGGTVLVGDDDLPFASAAAFFQFLVAGQTLLEVHGNLANGQVNATRIEVEDQVGGIGGGNTLVRLEGVVSAINGPGSFELLIQEIEKGAAVAGPVLAGLGNPAAVTISYTENTLFKLDDDTPTTSASLAVGKELDAKFAAFASEPFPAFEIEIDETPGLLAGDVSDLGEWPLSIWIQPDAATAKLLGSPAPLELRTPAGQSLALAAAPRLGQRLGFEGPALASGGFEARALHLAPGTLSGARIGAVVPELGLLDLQGGELGGGLERLLQPGLRTVEVAGAQIEEARFGGRTLGLGDLRPGQIVDLELEPGAKPGELRASRVRVR